MSSFPLAPRQLSFGSKAAHHCVRFPDARHPDAITPRKWRRRLGEGQLLHPIAGRRIGVRRYDRMLLSAPDHGRESASPGNGRADKRQAHAKAVSHLSIVQVRAEQGSAFRRQQNTTALERDMDLAGA